MPNGFYNNNSFQSPTSNQSFQPNNGFSNNQGNNNNNNFGNNNIPSPFGSGYFNQTTPSSNTHQNQHAAAGTPMMTNASNGIKENVQQNFNENMAGNNQTSGTKIRIVRDPDEVMRLLGHRGASVQSEIKASDPTDHRSSPISLDTAGSKEETSL